MIYNILPLRYMLFYLLVAVFYVYGYPATGHANDRERKNEHEVTIDEWLVLGPVAHNSPVYHDIPGIDGSAWSAGDLLESNLASYDTWRPEKGIEVSWPYSGLQTWRVKTAGDQGVLDPGESVDTHHDITWAAVYLKAERYLKATLTLESRGMIRALLNGLPVGDRVKKSTEPNKSVADRTDTEPDRQETGETVAGSLSHSIELKQGTHLLLVKLVHPAGSGITDWSLKASLKGIEHVGAISWGSIPERTVMQRDLSNAPRPAGVSISSDGALAAVHVRQDLPPDGTTETRIDIRHVSDGSLYRRYSGAMSVTGLQWVPEGRRFSYTTSGDNGTDLWMVDLDTGEKTRILRDIEDFVGYRWSPDATFVIYSVREQHEPGTHGVKRYHGLQDRRPGYHRRTFLYQHHVAQGTSRRLTAGLLSTIPVSIHPSGKELLYMRTHEDYEERPFGKTEYVILDLETMMTDSLFTLNFGGSARFSPDGNHIMVSAGPNDFDGLGADVPDSLIANDYDTQVYIYDRRSGEVDPVTRDFDPSISSARWDETGRHIYFVVVEGSYRPVYRYDTRNRTFRKYETGPDVVGSMDLARDRPVAVFTGSGASDTPKIWTIDFTRRNPQARMLDDPGARAYRHVHFGDVRTWTFTNDFGEEIDGHIYYPPGFDESRKYPVIVYYYGGTTPVSRAYGGRYPKELYASSGYLVYVLQPSGAIGFGQEFSARHVNDWGEIAGDEIIKGVGDFLEAHSYADPERVGAIGASYGGFMTMYLLTQTDLFAAAVSHAGISNLTSYWGEGFWGYQYSGVATAGSYPWNRQDIYVGQSPVFMADRIHTPLLLVTGMSDTNVPPGESLQMFTALKLLGRDVAFVAVEDQNHHILDYNKYIQWKDAILSWFDKWLKDEPGWWEERHGK